MFVKSADIDGGLCVYVSRPLAEWMCYEITRANLPYLTLHPLRQYNQSLIAQKLLKQGDPSRRYVKIPVTRQFFDARSRQDHFFEKPKNVFLDLP